MLVDLYLWRFSGLVVWALALTFGARGSIPEAVTWIFQICEFKRILSLLGMLPITYREAQVSSGITQFPPAVNREVIMGFGLLDPVWRQVTAV